MGIEVKANFDSLKKSRKIINYLSNHRLRVGFVGGETGENEENGTPVAEYAFYVEFGCGKGNVPRPFFRNAEKDIENMLDSKIQPLITQAVISGVGGKVVLKTIGAEVVKIIQDSINKGGYAANKESTLKYKKGNKPLIDTGTMVESVRFEIE